ncbi:hypothetical protein SPSYN_01135 [Sporotomaculum syntrophicum]|uniref:4Fe-4S ferredoxin-type domain-containing protein n=1 Tax=Sporotomaculum syntrophicum TaxID=182264 RepID=A0A9D2WPE4_9FIRM|nr:hypothetical protein SPSYN_01135 [Sporotomaculum syntrophicum]
MIQMHTPGQSFNDFKAGVCKNAFKGEQCIGCLKCVKACPQNTIISHRDLEKERISSIAFMIPREIPLRLSLECLWFVLKVDDFIVLQYNCSVLHYIVGGC